MHRLPRFLLVTLASAAFVVACDGGKGGKGADSPADVKGDNGESSGGDHPLVGKPAPDFTLESVNGQGTISMKSMEGKVVLVDFWATWCEPCKKSFPKYEELNVKYKDSGLQIVAISEDDDKDGVPEFGSEHGAKFPIGWDEGKEIAEKWQPKSMPQAFIVDKKGVVRHAHLGYHDGDEDKLDGQIKKLLDE